MAKLSQAQEPSMEEILASIRRIITEDDTEHAASVPPSAAPNLSTEAIDALFAVRPAEPLPATRPETRAPETRAAVVAPPSPAPRPSAPVAATLQTRTAASVRAEPMPSRADARSVVASSPSAARHEEATSARPLLSPGADAAIHAAFGSLSGSAPAAPGSARTLEDITKELLRPMLKAWLDSNLPPLVERLVRDEIERVSRGR